LARSSKSALGHVQKTISTGLGTSCKTIGGLWGKFHGSQNNIIHEGVTLNPYDANIFNTIIDRNSEIWGLTNYNPSYVPLKHNFNLDNNITYNDINDIINIIVLYDITLKDVIIQRSYPLLNGITIQNNSYVYFYREDWLNFYKLLKGNSIFDLTDWDVYEWNSDSAPIVIDNSTIITNRYYASLMTNGSESILPQTYSTSMFKPKEYLPYGAGSRLIQSKLEHVNQMYSFADLNNLYTM
jgi:hypothetical protein